MISYAQFKTQVLPFTLKVESGYSNTSGDTGGETYRGITRKNNSSWPGWKLLDKKTPIAKGKVFPELEELVAKFYWDFEFNLPDFDYLNSTKVAMVLFDWRIHGGLSASKIQAMLTRRFRIKTNGSGSFDRDTILLMNRINEKQLTDAIIDMRREKIASIIKRNPSQAKFKKGWTNRLNELSTITA
jgi:lysozyme family protein